MSTTPTTDERIAVAEARFAELSKSTAQRSAEKLDDRIAAASAEGDWQTVNALNADKLADLIGRTDPATGAIEPAAANS
jgi:hypothetical protein